MAILDIKVPQLSESVSEATLLQWRKRVGEALAQGEVLVEIETDKVVLEAPAPQAGVLTHILMADGAKVTSGQVIAQMDTLATASVSAAPTGIASAPAAVATAPAPALVAATSAPRVMPAAEKILAERGLSPQAVTATGPGGRITKADALAAPSPSPSVPSPSAPSPVSVPSAAPFIANAAEAERPVQRVPMSRLRQRVAERLLQSQANNAILTTFNEVNMAPVMELRKRSQERFEKTHGIKLGFMSFFVKAAVHALRRYPILNASVDENDIVYHGYFDIGIAVGSPRGLVVPVLRDADQLTFAQIEKQIADFGERAQNGKLSIEELSGGTFSISNGGVFGSMLSTPIINPPQSAILGVHATRERPVVENGQIVIRPINYLAMSYDHRIVDGREAVLGLVAMKEVLEDPAKLLLEM